METYTPKNISPHEVSSVFEFNGFERTNNSLYDMNLIRQYANDPYWAYRSIGGIALAFFGRAWVAEFKLTSEDPQPYLDLLKSLE